MNKQEFLQQVAPVIQQVASERGYRFPSAIIAQAALESGWGQSVLSSQYFNFFGMKCGSTYNGKSINMTTKEEYQPGTMTTIRDNFRAYNNIREGIEGYFNFICMQRYQNLKTATSPEDYIQRLKNDGWATASAYVSAVTTILNANNLRQFDSVPAPTPQPVQNIDDIARRVIRGEFGNGADRRRRIAAAGYDYNQVQARVNQLLK